jgi:hypothetical protein
VGIARFRRRPPPASIDSNPPTGRLAPDGSQGAEDTMAKSLFGSLAGLAARRWTGGTLRRRGVLIPFLVVGLSLVFASSTLAANVTTVTIVDSFTIVNHFDPWPPCNDFGGSTDTATGIEHFHYTDLGDSVAVSYDETFWITTVPDRPTEATYHQQGTDAWAFHLAKDGSVVFHESFHDNRVTFDNGETYLMMRFYTTFVYANGEVLVDHNFGANTPPEGCA